MRIANAWVYRKLPAQEIVWFVGKIGIACCAEEVGGRIGGRFLVHTGKTKNLCLVVISPWQINVHQMQRMPCHAGGCVGLGKKVQLGSCPWISTTICSGQCIYGRAGGRVRRYQALRASGFILNSE